MVGSTRRKFIALCAVAGVSGVILAAGHHWQAGTAACAPGMVRADGDEPGERGACVRLHHPESFREMAQNAAQWQAKLGAPPPGAVRAAVEKKAAMQSLTATVPNAAGSWSTYGVGPLIADDANYPNVNGEGLATLSGRVDSFAYDPVAKRVFALPGNGGLWASNDWASVSGPTWTAIGDNLPTSNNGAVAWLPGTGGAAGTLVVLSGNSDFLGSPSYGGLGAYWSNDLGHTWNHASGIPDGLFGFELAVDASKPGTLYAATSRGLFRSTDAGHSFSNVKLPTYALDPSGNRIDCSGVQTLGPCQFASVVTSVAVQAPGGSSSLKGGRVLAAVGFQLGNANTFPDGTVRAPANGLYRSDTGAPGSFQLLNVSAANTNLPNGFTPANRIGRVAFGIADGADQDHGYIYAVVQDAILFNGGLPFIDINPADLGIPTLPVGGVPTVFNGLYVSPDFGDTWTRAADGVEVQLPSSGSALVGLNQATGYGPGVQAWYNLWVRPDPTVTSQNVPARLFFGLEEVWSSISSAVPQNGTLQSGPADYHVIGAYYAGTSCGGLNLGALGPVPPICPTRNPPNAVTTTHPDQHSSLLVPDGSGGVYLFVGNDGGVNLQHIAAGANPDNAGWGNGANAGLYTTLPYNFDIAKDGTVWFGLQDNGSGKIDPTTRKMYMAFGGDGFFVAVDPNDSKTAYEEYVNGAISVTTDGGTNWNSINPNLTNPSFSTPFAMDPKDPKHLITGGQNIAETLDGPTTCTSSDPTGTAPPTCTWVTVFDLGSNPAPDSSVHTTSALDVNGDNAYVAYCGRCSGFGRPDLGVHAGIATNVGGSKPPKKGAVDGWHFAKATGLPNRYINWIKIDPNDPKTIYIAVGGYLSGDLAPPGTYLDNTQNIGAGHVYKSSDAGESFADISGNLPNISALSLELFNGQIVLGTQIGAFISSDTLGSTWAPLGATLPNVPVTTLKVSPGNPKLLLASTYGRGIWSYTPDTGTTTGGTTTGGTTTGGTTTGGTTTGGTTTGGTTTGGTTTGASSGRSGGGGAMPLAMLLGMLAAVGLRRRSLRPTR